MAPVDRPLGDNQVAMLLALHLHGGAWHDGCGWLVGTRSLTLSLLSSLERRGYVRTRGTFKGAPFAWVITPAGVQALDATEV